jgi:glycosyltransferase involved in cell wall biosynthesis
MRPVADAPLAASVIVPTYNRPDRLLRCLTHLAALDYPRDRFEILVVDDGGSEDLDRLVDRAALAIDVRILRQAHAGPALARNLGAREARYPLLVFVDDDCLPRPDWLRAISRQYTGRLDDAVSGQTINALGTNHCAAASQLLIDYLRDYYRHPGHGERFATSSNLAFPAEGFRALGGFDATFSRAGGEDREFCDRWVGTGRAIRYADDAIVDHHHAMSLTGFWRQHVNYGRGAYQFRQARKRRQASPVPVEPLSFYLGLVRTPARAARGRVILTLLTVLSQVANATGFAVQALSD